MSQENAIWHSPFYINGKFTAYFEFAAGKSHNQFRNGARVCETNLAKLIPQEFTFINGQ